jgi:hypothetical protein
MCSVLSRRVDHIHVCDVYIGYFDFATRYCMESKYKNAFWCFIVWTWQNVKGTLTNTRKIALIPDDVLFRYECSRKAFRRSFPVKVERNWNVNGTRMERKSNVNETRPERVPQCVPRPNAFPVRLFMRNNVYQSYKYEKFCSTTR